MDDLETHRYALKEMSTSSISSPTPPDVLAEIKAAIDSSERDLAKVNAWLK
jgi:HD-like signal output (HDOD) protein